MQKILCVLFPSPHVHARPEPVQQGRQQGGKPRKKLDRKVTLGTPMVFLYGDSKTSKTSSSNKNSNSSNSSSSSEKETEGWIDLA